MVTVGLYLQCEYMMYGGREWQCLDQCSSKHLLPILLPKLTLLNCSSYISWYTLPQISLMHIFRVLPWPLVKIITYLAQLHFTFAIFSDDSNLKLAMQVQVLDLSEHLICGCWVNTRLFLKCLMLFGQSFTTIFGRHCQTHLSEWGWQVF